MKNKYKTIGILGGMGPVASANMYNKIISQAQKQLGAVQDIDYPLIILYSIGLEGFDETGIKDYAKVEKQLVAGVKHLEKCGAEIISLQHRILFLRPIAGRLFSADCQYG